MILNDSKKELTELLFQALIDDIGGVKAEFSQDNIIGYAILCDSGFLSFGSAACTEKQLIKQSALLVEKLIEKDETSAQQYVATFAAEWDHYNDYRRGHFAAVNALNKIIVEASRNNDIAGVKVKGNFDYDLYYQFYKDVITETLEKLKASGIFNSPPFCDDLLLGLQFSDPDDDEKQWVLSVSEKINTRGWHNKMVESYRIS